MLPLAFHVDYWNDIGWVDPYSQARFSDRQRQYSRRRGVGFVVTPQFLLDGQPYQRPLIFNDLNGKTQAINRTSPRAAIRISESRLPSSISAQIDARVAEPAMRDAELFVAVFENNLQSAVTSGENAGIQLWLPLLASPPSNARFTSCGVPTPSPASDTRSPASSTM